MPGDVPLNLILNLTLTFHLISVDLAAAVPLVCIWLHRRERRRGDATAGRAGRLLATWAMLALLAGALFGLAAFALHWVADNEALFESLRAMPRSRLWWGVAELVFYLACMAVYVRWWGRLPAWLHHGLAVLSSTNLMYHFPPLFAAMVVLSTRPDAWQPGQQLTYAELMALLADGETLARVTHSLLASLAVAGVALMAVSLRLRRQEGAEQDDCRRVAVWGGRLALIAALCQLPSGVVLLLQLRPQIRELLLMQDIWATAFFAGSLLVMLALLHHLAAVALGESGRATLVRSMALLGLLVLLMVSTGQRARHRVAEWTSGAVASPAIGEPAGRAASLTSEEAHRAG